MTEMTILNEHEIPLLPPLFVQALCDYEASDDTSLGFRKGDIIQVLTELESGWWDGVLKNFRGWFPSNLVTEVSDPHMPQDADCSQQRLGSPSVDIVPQVTRSASPAMVALHPAGRSASHRSHVCRQSWIIGDDAAFTVASLQQAESPPPPAVPSLLENTWPWLRGSADSGENARPGAGMGGGLRWSGMATAGSSDSLARSPKQYVDPKRKRPAQNGTAVLPFHACDPHKFILCPLCKDPNPAKKRASVISTASIPERQLPAFLAVPKDQALTLFYRYRQMRRLKHRHKKELASADRLIVQESPGAAAYRKLIEEDYQSDCRELRRHWRGQGIDDVAEDDGTPLGWRDLLS